MAKLKMSDTLISWTVSDLVDLMKRMVAAEAMLDPTEEEFTHIAESIKDSVTKAIKTAFVLRTLNDLAEEGVIRNLNPPVK